MKIVITAMTLESENSTKIDKSIYYWNEVAEREAANLSFPINHLRINLLQIQRSSCLLCSVLSVV